ncbi:hypothetical protein ASAP_2669 [Asaia bogorensis]|uniref:Uncharacterized protein n=1 Tax=Asaia bogorensis TaxID=91915 RepID=A0A060QHV8_9PROT|nr:hypothetical protein ASAP_2669 [Asaia bogorensis]
MGVAFLLPRLTALFGTAVRSSITPDRRAGSATPRFTV